MFRSVGVGMYGWVWVMYRITVGYNFKDEVIGVVIK